MGLLPGRVAQACIALSRPGGGPAAINQIVPALTAEHGSVGMIPYRSVPAPHTVEVLSHAEDLLYMIDEVHKWLYDNRVHAPCLRFHWSSETLVFQITFNTWADATSFAKSFGGRFL